MYFCTIINISTEDMGYEYMSQEGYDKLVEELRHMEQVELPQVREMPSPRHVHKAT